MRHRLPVVTLRAADTLLGGRRRLPFAQPYERPNGSTENHDGCLFATTLLAVTRRLPTSAGSDGRV